MLASLNTTTINHDGKSCIRGMRVTLGLIVMQIASARNIDDLVLDYPNLEWEYIVQALRYAAWECAELLLHMKWVTYSMTFCLHAKHRFVIAQQTHKIPSCEF